MVAQGGALADDLRRITGVNEQHDRIRFKI